MAIARPRHAAVVVLLNVQLPIALGAPDVALADQNWPSIIGVTDGYFRRQAASPVALLRLGGAQTHRRAPAISRFQRRESV